MQQQARRPSSLLLALLCLSMGARAEVRDTCANQWKLVPAGNGLRRLMVLPAQAPTEWIDPQIQGAGPAKWSTLRADELGFLWLTRNGRAFRLDPRKPQQGVVEMPALPTSVATRQHWKVVARMPASNHDLTAAVLNNKLYVAGGLTAEWGFPTRSHSFEELWELDGKSWKWRVAARLGRARIYCTTAAFAQKIWILGGDVIEPDGTRHAVQTVQLFDPTTGAISEGVPNTIARPMPVALAAGGRLYVVGNAKGHFDEPGQMESIGVGETAWRREPGGPPGMGPLAGATLDGKLYIAVKDRGLAIFDTATARWETTDATHKPRSSQMTAYKGEIWMMGGRDTAAEDQTLIYSPQTRAWRTGPLLPRPLSWGAAEVLNGRLIVTGGAASYGRDYLYNDLTFLLHE